MLSLYETLSELNRSLRGAVMPDPGTMLFAGEHAFEAWYTRADVQGDLTDEKWTAPIEPPDGMDSTIEDPERAQAIAALSDASGGVVAGGTLDGNPWLARYTNNGQPLPWTPRFPVRPHAARGPGRARRLGSVGVRSAGRQ